MYLFMGIGDWGLGIGDWGLGPIPNPQSPIPNPQSPWLCIILIKSLYLLFILIKYYIIYKEYNKKAIKRKVRKNIILFMFIFLTFCNFLK